MMNLGEPQIAAEHAKQSIVCQLHAWSHAGAGSDSAGWRSEQAAGPDQWTVTELAAGVGGIHHKLLP